MECGHAFCDDCWRQHLTIQIKDGNARRLPCMAVKCGVICDETKVCQTVPEVRLVLKASIRTYRTPHRCLTINSTGSNCNTASCCQAACPFQSRPELSVLDAMLRELRCGASWRAASSS